MADVKTAYGTSTSFTITLASLASAAARSSVAIDNSSNLFNDALVFLQVRTAGTLALPFLVPVYAYGSADDGTTYGDTVAGTDSAPTLNSPTQLAPIGLLQAPTTATTYKGGPWSVARAFGGVLPKFWGIVVVNSTGAAFDSSGGNFIAKYQGVYTTVS